MNLISNLFQKTGNLSYRACCLHSKTVWIRLMAIQGTSAMQQSSRWGIASNHKSNCYRKKKANELKTKAEISLLDKEGEPELQCNQQEAAAAAREEAPPAWWWAAVRRQLCCSVPAKAEESKYWNILVNSGLPASANISFAPSASCSFLGFIIFNLCKDLPSYPMASQSTRWRKILETFGEIEVD